MRGTVDTGMAATMVSVPVETRSPTGQTNVVIVGSDPALLVDPAAVTDQLNAAIAERDVGHVAVTHHHPDHVGAVEHYAEQCDATVWARTGRTEEFAAAAGVTPDRTFAEATAIPTGGESVRVLDTPGHAPEHVAFAHGTGDDGGPAALLCGDLAVAEGSVAVAAPHGDLRAYLTSLRRVRAMSPDRLLPGHGPAMSGADVRSAVERLISHRLDREQRVDGAVQEGAETVSDVCDRAYDKDLTGVRDLAEATVRAHLDKLAVEGRVKWDGKRVGPA